MRPRLHNLVSYAVAQLVLMLVVGVRLAGGAAQRALPIAAIVGIGMWCLHFARRAGESAFIHRYSKPQVPLGDVITEYLYYWGFAVWNALSLLSESYRGPALGWVVVGAAVFVLAELGNAKAHRMLRDMRPAGTATRVIPRGFLFERVSSPHYLFEILTWVGFALATQTWASLAFLLLGSGILASWARARHLAYRKDFDGREGRASYPVERRALIPGVF
jgi:very-long-chain enoyl-CoA reductase